MGAMGSTTGLEWADTGLQVSAGWADTDRPDVRYLMIGVPYTHDWVRLDWYDGADFGGGAGAAGWLGIGTLPVREVLLRKGEIAAGGHAEEPRFGPTAAGILRAVAEPLTDFARAHPDVLRRLTERVSALNGNSAFAGSVAEYAAAGSALGTLVADAATAGAALGALIGISVYLTD
jgi:hypothetical protein